MGTVSRPTYIVHIVGIPEEEGEKGAERLSEEIIAEDFLSLMKDKHEGQ